MIFLHVCTCRFVFPECVVSRLLLRFAYVDCLFCCAGMLRFAVCYLCRVSAQVRAARQRARSRVAYEHLLSGRYTSTQRASRSISAQAVAPSVTFLSTKQTSWVARVRSSGPVRDGETKILNAPTSKANHMIMRIRCVVCTKSKASRKCFRELRHIN